MTSNRKFAANRRNSRKSRGPRTAAGKATASRNALRHGLAALTHQQAMPSAEIEQFARELCGDDDNPALFTQAVRIAAGQRMLGAIRAHQVAIVERLRERPALPLTINDIRLQSKLSLEATKLRVREIRQAEEEVKAGIVKLFAQYKNQIAAKAEREVPASVGNYEEIINWMSLDGFLSEDHAIWLILELASDESQTGNNKTLEPARQQPATGSSLEPARVQIPRATRDEHEALEAATPDLVRLDRYERRTWSGLKRTIREFINIKTMTRFSSSAT